MTQAHGRSQPQNQGSGHCARLRKSGCKPEDSFSSWMHHASYTSRPWQVLLCPWTSLLAPRPAYPFFILWITAWASGSFPGLFLLCGPPSVPQLLCVSLIGHPVPALSSPLTYFSLAGLCRDRARVLFTGLSLAPGILVPSGAQSVLVG